MTAHERGTVSDTEAQQLSMFQSSSVISNRLHMGGNVKEPTLQPAEEYRHGQRVVLLVVARVDYIGFDEDKLGLVRDQKLKIAEAYDPSSYVDTADLLNHLRRDNEALFEQRAAVVFDDEIAEFLRGNERPEGEDE